MIHESFKGDWFDVDAVDIRIPNPKHLSSSFSLAFFDVTYDPVTKQGVGTLKRRKWPLYYHAYDPYEFFDLIAAAEYQVIVKDWKSGLSKRFGIIDIKPLPGEKRRGTQSFKMWNVE